MGKQSRSGSPQERAGTGLGWPAPNCSPNADRILARGGGGDAGAEGPRPLLSFCGAGLLLWGTGQLKEACWGLGFCEDRLTRARRGGGTLVLGAELLGRRRWYWGELCGL